MITHPVYPAQILSASPGKALSPVQPVNPVQPAPDATQSDTPAFTLGQKYLAQVEARLMGGSSLVNVAGQLLDMRLPPAAAKVGNQIDLTLVAQSPRLQFLLASNAPATSQTATLSPIGQFLAHLFKPAPPTLSQTAPLLPAPPTTSHALPSTLQQAIAQSGLFYESHLAQWANGRKSLDSVKQMPQSALPAHTAIMDLETPAPDTAKILPIVQQQLQALETGQLHWRGDIWPDQAMEWIIHEQPANHAGTTESPARWQTHLRLQLPKLSEINATLIIDAQGVRIKLNASAEATTHLMKDEQAALIAALSAAGLSVQEIEIKHHAPTQTS
ncbi:MAG TPA: flagellar hook-length control protein FliK [Nitrosomonas mobilis]|nr:flagellar hook-length control protein FliK [Nitrosomonas mobilis]